MMIGVHTVTTLNRRKTEDNQATTVKKSFQEIEKTPPTKRNTQKQRFQKSDKNLAKPKEKTYIYI